MRNVNASSTTKIKGILFFVPKRATSFRAVFSTTIYSSKSREPEKNLCPSGPEYLITFINFASLRV